jgi:hypothetical protein
MSGGPPEPEQRPPVTRLPTGVRGEAKSGGPPAGSEGELDQAIAVLASRIDEEFRITERLDSKTRQAFALSAGFYAVIQTVAFGSFAQADVSGTERVVLLLCAVAAGGLLARVAHLVTRAEELRGETDIRPSAIVKWANEAGDNPEHVRSQLVTQLSDVAEKRDAENKKRGGRYDAVVDAARLALIAAGVELLVAVAARL